ncbi:hypothetical protein FJTKL_05949 [Diaporthe vaccinii]|uniref:ABC transporter domain-containing protein n=1 Tax=Diaporthe vaccinii TaxID=105482 RepID=A0ABR4DRG3_9PEZI
MTLAFQAAAIIDIAFNLSSPSPIKEVAKASADSQASDKALSEFAVSQAVRTLLYSQSGDGSATVKTASIAFDGLSVRAPGGTVHPAKTLPQALLNTFGPDQVNFVRNATSSWLGGKADESSGKAILTNFIGLVKPGEMLFVLGRPGSGCSTFLQTAANRSALNMTGKLSYSNMSAAEFGRQHERETVYLSEEDRHITSLSVRDILNFALRTSLPPKTRTKSVVKSLVNTIADHLGLMHALHTSVGGALFPGVSGGERKRYVLRTCDCNHSV